MLMSDGITVGDTLRERRLITNICNNNCTVNRIAYNVRQTEKQTTDRTPVGTLPIALFRKRL